MEGFFSCQELVCFADSLVKKEHTATAFSGVTKGSVLQMAWEDSGGGMGFYELVLKFSLIKENPIKCSEFSRSADF